MRGMLRLAAPTSPDWLSRAIDGLPELLVDHAHCELKAASTALGLVFRYPERAELLRPLSELAREELEHFELMLAVLAARGIPFRRMTATPYASRLREIVRRDEPGRLLDTLLCCAFIEARSCERMQLLAAGLPDAELADVYRGLLASEARHHATYVDLARELAPHEAVAGRLDAVSRHEASILAGPPAGPRLHE